VEEMEEMELLPLKPQIFLLETYPLIPETKIWKRHSENMGVSSRLVLSQIVTLASPVDLDLFPSKILVMLKMPLLVCMVTIFKGEKFEWIKPRLETRIATVVEVALTAERRHFAVSTKKAIANMVLIVAFSTNPAVEEEEETDLVLVIVIGEEVGEIPTETAIIAEILVEMIMIVVIPEEMTHVIAEILEETIPVIAEILEKTIPATAKIPEKMNEENQEETMTVGSPEEKRGN